MDTSASHPRFSFAVIMGFALTGCNDASDSLEGPEEEVEIEVEVETPPSPEPEVPQLHDLDQEMYPFAVRIDVQWDDNTPSLCSGAVIGSHTIITAAHCTRDRRTDPHRMPTAATTIHYGPGWTSSQQIASAVEGDGWWEDTKTDIGLFHVADAIEVTKPALSASPLPANSARKMRAMGRMRDGQDYVGKYTITSDRTVASDSENYLFFDVAVTHPGDSGGPWIFDYTTSAGLPILGAVTSGTSASQDRASKTSQSYGPILSKAAEWGDVIATYVLPPSGCETMNPGEGLAFDQALWSCDGRFELKFKSDGKLVLYKHSGDTTAPIWSPRVDTAGADKLILQEDGNLVIYPTDGIAVWASDTYGRTKNWLRVQNDGNVVLYDSFNFPRWATRTSGM